MSDQVDIGAGGDGPTPGNEDIEGGVPLPTVEMVAELAGPDAVDVSVLRDGKLLKEVLSSPEGGEEEGTVRNGMDVSVYYKGTLADGTVFDSSQRPNAPFTFKIGQGNVIEGWERGILGSKKGEKIKLYCHPDVAYRSTPHGAIPANSILIFEIEVVNFTAEDLTKNKNGCILRFNIKEGGSKYLNPNHGSLVEVLIRGTHKDTIVFPERKEKFRLGEGCEVGIPYGVEKALYKFTSGEISMLKIKGAKYGLPKAEYEKHGLTSDTPIEFYVELVSHENTKEPWQLDGAEKLAESRRLKEVGNNFVGKANYRVAFKNYKLIVDHLKAEALLTGDDEEERKKLLLAAYLNMALCNLKLERPTLAIRNCDDALDMDANNAKALFRRGQAYLGVNLPEKANPDFKKVLEVEPSNTAAAAQLAMVEKKIKENLKKEKQMYSKMFSGASENSAPQRNGNVTESKPTS